MRSNDLCDTAGGEHFVLISLVKEWYAPKKSRIYQKTFFALTLGTFNIGDDSFILKNKYFLPFTSFIHIFQDDEWNIFNKVSNENALPILKYFFSLISGWLCIEYTHHTQN